MKARHEKPRPLKRGAVTDLTPHIDADPAEFPSYATAAGRLEHYNRELEGAAAVKAVETVMQKMQSQLLEKDMLIEQLGEKVGVLEDVFLDSSPREVLDELYERYGLNR